MKKLYLTLAVTIVSFGLAIGQCTIDQSNTELVAPPDSTFPCVERSVAFSNAIQMAIPASAQVATVDSIVVTSIVGFPTGITYVCNPAGCSFPGGSNACINFEGTTTDPVGDYPLTFDGNAYTNLGTFPFSQLASFGFAIAYNLTVINTGDPCHPVVNTGIKNFSSELNSMLYVFPNPNNGTFKVALDAGRRVNGELLVLDATGKSVYSQRLDAMGKYITDINLSNLSAGLYTVQLKTAEGFAAKRISIQ